MIARSAKNLSCKGRYVHRVPFVNPLMGFTLVELLVVISIISLLSSIVFASLNSARVKARNSRRIADIRQIITALEFYYDKYDAYPQDDNSGFESFTDYSRDGNFISQLQTEGFLPRVPVDPINADN